MDSAACLIMMHFDENGVDATFAGAEKNAAAVITKRDEKRAAASLEKSDGENIYLITTYDGL